MLCPSLALLNNPCPLCGMTRAFFRIWKMDLQGAASLNPLAVPVFLLFLMEVIFRLALHLKFGAAAVTPGFARADCRIHAVLGAAYLVYAIFFVALRWNLTL